MRRPRRRRLALPEEIHFDQAGLQGVRRAVRAERAAGVRGAGGEARHGFGLDQRPLSALAAHRRARAVLPGLARRARCPHAARSSWARACSRPTYRYHPSVVAQAFATLGTLFPGRVVLGMGTGESLNEVPATGLEWPEQKERTARFREALRLIRTLWSEERVSFEGQYYQTKLATIYDRPRAAGADLRRGRRPVHREARGPGGRRIHLHQRQEVGAVHARPCCRTCRRGSTHPAGRGPDPASSG